MSCFQGVQHGCTNGTSGLPQTLAHGGTQFRRQPIVAAQVLRLNTPRQQRHGVGATVAQPKMLREQVRPGGVGIEQSAGHRGIATGRNVLYQGISQPASRQQTWVNCAGAK